MKRWKLTNIYKRHWCGALKPTCLEPSHFVIWWLMCMNWKYLRNYPVLLLCRKVNPINTHTNNILSTSSPAMLMCVPDQTLDALREAVHHLGPALLVRPRTLRLVVIGSSSVVCNWCSHHTSSIKYRTKRSEYLTEPGTHFALSKSNTQRCTRIQK